MKKDAVYQIFNIPDSRQASLKEFKHVNYNKNLGNFYCF